MNHMATAAICALLAPSAALADFVPGVEVAVPRHLDDGEEFDLDIEDLNRHGGLLFSAAWTPQEGGGRPLTKGTGGPLSDPSSPLLFPRNFNRVSAPDANSCAGCHNLPAAGGGGDFVTNVFVLGQRFDHATFDHADQTPLRGAVDELGRPVTLDSIANSRATLGMNGSGYIERLAIEMTDALRAQRDALGPGEATQLVAKGVDFGELAREADGSWDVSGVEGLPWPSIVSTGSDDPPNLLIRPFHQAGAVVSLRQFTNNAMNHHHGIQPVERFGNGDPDGDGFVNEMTIADVTAASVWQATLSAPGRVIPRDRDIERAVWNGEQLFSAIGCGDCHVPELPLYDATFTEPNPYSPPGNLQPGEYPTFEIDLGHRDLPKPRLDADRRGVTHVPAYTDLKLHDITAGPGDPNIEGLNMHHAGGSPEFFGGNSRFLTKKLWGAANEPPYFHHGKFTTLREAIEAHAGEAQYTTDAFEALDDYDQGSIIEFIKTLQVLPEGTRHLIVDERGRNRPWPPRGRGHGRGHGHGHR